MRFKIIRFVLFALLGFLLFYMGHTLMEWEFWAVIAWGVLIGIVGYFEGNRKGDKEK